MTAKKDLDFPLSKCCNPTDREELAEELRVVRAYVGDGVWWWEYAMTHRAISDWASRAGERDPLQICDIGQARSRFHHTLINATSEDIVVVDPALPELTDDQRSPRGVYHKRTIEEHATRTFLGQYDVLTCLAVIEHVADLTPFFRACAMLLKPGGLLFLTTDCWNCDGPDTTPFHAQRERIYNPGSIRKLGVRLRELGFKSFGRSDWAYPGDTRHNSYSVASLAMVKK